MLCGYQDYRITALNIQGNMDCM